MIRETIITVIHFTKTLSRYDLHLLMHFGGVGAYRAGLKLDR